MGPAIPRGTARLQLDIVDAQLRLRRRLQLAQGAASLGALERDAAVARFVDRVRYSEPLGEKSQLARMLALDLPDELTETQLGVWLELSALLDDDSFGSSLQAQHEPFRGAPDPARAAAFGAAVGPIIEAAAAALADGYGPESAAGASGSSSARSTAGLRDLAVRRCAAAARRRARGARVVAPPERAHPRRREDPRMLRAALLSAAGNRGLARFVSKHGKRFGAYRFVAGETLDEFMEVVAKTNAAGMRVAAGLLGEDVLDREAATAVARDYERILDRFAAAGARANVALKLTHLGLGIDRDLAAANLASVVRHAAGLRNFVRIDMEQSARTEATLAIYRELRSKGLDNVGTVLQAYLRRSQADLESLLGLAPNLRLVKGAYLEPASIAYPDKRDVDRSYVKLIETSLLRGGFTAIATHDDAVIDHCGEFIRARSIEQGAYEFQMLYGVRPRLQADLIRRGHPLRIAVPFGSQWYPYFMRRLAERPANVTFFFASMLRG